GLARRPSAGGQCADVAGEGRRVAPAHGADRAHGADAEAEVVVAEPVAEVVLRAQVAPARSLRSAAEVRRLVPAVPSFRQGGDDELEVRLHRIGLALELRTVGVREARARLGFELVRGEVLRRELDRLGEIE